MTKTLILVAVAAFIVGCSGGDSTDTNASTTSPGPTTTPAPSKPTNSVETPKMAPIPPKP